MTAWINHIIRGNEELYEARPYHFSDAVRALVEEEGLQASPTTLQWWETLSRAAMEHEDTRMMRYASGPALRVLRERLFPSETLEDVAALFEMNPGLLREIEEDKHPHPNMRAAYGHRLKEWAKAEEKEKEPKIEEPPPHTPIPNPDANLDGLQNRQGILLTPQQQQDRSEARRLATAILSRGKHGVGVWLSRKIGIPPFTISSFKASFFRNTEEAREHVEKFLAYMKQTTVDDVAAEFGKESVRLWAHLVADGRRIRIDHKAFLGDRRRSRWHESIHHSILYVPVKQPRPQQQGAHPRRSRLCCQRTKRSNQSTSATTRTRSTQAEPAIRRRTSVAHT